MVETATAVKDSGSGAAGTGTGEAATSAAPATALSSVQAAFKDSTPASSAGTGDTQQQTQVEGQPLVAPVTDLTPPPGGEGLAQLRSAYDALKAKYARFDGQDHDQMFDWWQQRAAFEQDPLGWYRQLGNELTEHPEYSQRMTPPKEEPEPQPDLYTVVDGEKVAVMSHKRQAEWRAWNDKRMEAKFNSLINPMQQWVGQARSEAQRASIVRESRDTVSRVMTEMRTMPGFTEGSKQIGEILSKLDPELKKEIGAIASLHVAYNMYMRDNYHPNLKSTLEKQIREEYAREAGASSGNVRPGGGQGAGQKRSPSNQNELAAALKSGAYATTT